jgi:hypothetical protein
MLAKSSPEIIEVRGVTRPAAHRSEPRKPSGGG